MIRCPVCNCLTIDDFFEVITDICPVCFWQYDWVSHKHPDISIGPNRVSLNTARENYKLYKACEERFVHLVRRVKMKYNLLHNSNAANASSLLCCSL